MTRLFAVPLAGPIEQSVVVGEVKRLTGFRRSRASCGVLSLLGVGWERLGGV